MGTLVPFGRKILTSTDLQVLAKYPTGSTAQHTENPRKISEEEVSNLPPSNCKFGLVIRRSEIKALKPARREIFAHVFNPLLALSRGTVLL